MRSCHDVRFFRRAKFNVSDNQFLRRSSAFLLVMAVSLFVALAQSAWADSAVAWGYNGYGQLGDGTTTQRIAPVEVVGMSSGVTAVSDSLAIQNGAAYAWGYNGDGELGNGTTTNSSTPVPVSGLTNGVTAIARSQFYDSLAIQNGAAYAWGYNDDGELGNGTTTNSSTPVAVSGMSGGVTAIAEGIGHSLAIRSGAAYSWGFNPLGELGNGTTTNSNVPVVVTGLSGGVTGIAAGFNDSFAIKNGAAYSWGNNQYGQLGDGTTTNRSTPVAIAGLGSGVTAIAAGYESSIAMKNGNVYAWGSNFEGELGDGSTTDKLTPELIDPTDLKNIVAIAAGEESSYALSSDGSLWVWGDNNAGELGLGTSTSDYLTPQHLLPPTGYIFTSIAAGANDPDAIATLAAVPEPASGLLFALGSLAGVIALRRKLAVQGCHPGRIATQTGSHSPRRLF